MTQHSVTIVGGGFAGLACANELSARRFQVTVIDRKPNFEFIPNIHELVSGVKTLSQVRLPLRAGLEAIGHHFLRGDVTGIDALSRTVTLANGRQITGDFLVLAAGSEDADFGVTGVDKHALRFRTAADGQAVQRRVRAIARDPKAAPVVVVGAGLAGVEVVGELLRRYSDTALQIQLVEAKATLLPGLASPIGDYVEGLLAKNGVICTKGHAVNRVSPKSLVLSDGRRIRSALTIWTGGPRPADFLASSHLAEASQWAPADQYLEHQHYENVFLAGDTAAVSPALRKQAYHALDMGQCVAANINARARGRRLRTYRPAEKPTLLALGDLDTVLIAGKHAVAGPTLATGKELVFSTVMTQLDRRSGLARAKALVDRGRQAQRRLLWPALSDWKTLQKQARLQRIS